MALGPKPDFIRNAEGKMWGMVMDVALGKDARKALQSFVNECREDILSLEENQEALSTGGSPKTQRLGLPVWGQMSI